MDREKCIRAHIQCYPTLIDCDEQPCKDGEQANHAEEDGAYCQGCGFEPPNGWIEYLEVDHRQPRSHGGADSNRNRVLLSAPCNDVKGNKLTLVELLQKRIKDGRMLNPTWDVN